MIRRIAQYGFLALLAVVPVLPAHAADSADPFAVPIASTNNLIAGNTIDVLGVTVSDPVTGVASIVRATDFVPTEEEADGIDVTVPPASGVIDAEPRSFASPPTQRFGFQPFSAVRVASDLDAGDSFAILDADHGNVPVATMQGPYTGWLLVPTTTTFVLQVTSNGDGIFTGSVTATGLGTMLPADLHLTEGTSAAVRTASTDGVEVGMYGAFAAGVVWPNPVFLSAAPALPSPTEEAEVRFLESQLARLTQAARTDLDPIIQRDDDGWMYAPSTFRDGGVPGATYHLQLLQPPRTERSVNALLNEVGVSENGVLLRVLVDGTTLAPAEHNFRQVPQALRAFRVAGQDAEVRVESPSSDGLIASIERALVVEPSRADAAAEYLRLSMGPLAADDARTLTRLAEFYGTKIVATYPADDRVLVTLADWLRALLMEQRGGARPTLQPFDILACPTVEACPAFYPLFPPAPSALPADAAAITLDPLRAAVTGPWASVAAGEQPIDAPLAGRMTSMTSIASLGLAANDGRATLSWTFVAPRTATATFSLAHATGPAMGSLALRIFGPQAEVRREIAGGGAVGSVDAPLGAVPVTAGDTVKVVVSATTAIIGPMTVALSDPLPTSITSVLTTPAAGAEQIGGTFTNDGWKPDAVLSALRFAGQADASGVRLRLELSGLEPCPASGCLDPSQLLSVTLDDVTVAVDTVGTALLLRSGESIRTLALDGRTSTEIDLVIRPDADMGVATLAAAAHRVFLPLPKSTVAQGAELAVTLGSLDPAFPASPAVTVRMLRVHAASFLGPRGTRTARLQPTRRDAERYALFTATDPGQLAQTATPTVSRAVTAMGDASPTLELTGLTDGQPVHVVAAVLGRGGAVSARSAVITLTPTADAPAPPVPAVIALAPPEVTDRGSGLVEHAGQPVPPSRAMLRLGDALTLDPSLSVPPGEQDVLVQWSVGRDANTAPDSRSSHVYLNPGTYQPTFRLLAADGSVTRMTAPEVRIDPDTSPALVLFTRPGNARIAAGGALDLRGTYRATEGDTIPETWTVTLDFGDGTPAVRGDTAVVAALTGGPSGTPLQHTYASACACTLVVTVFDETGAERAQTRRTVLVGPVEEPPAESTLRVRPASRTGSGSVEFDIDGIPRGMQFLAWDFGDARSLEEQATHPSFPERDMFAPAKKVASTPVELLGDLPIILRVRSATGATTRAVSSVAIRPPVATFDLDQRILFGAVPGAANGLALSRVLPTGERTYIADVSVDASGFVLLPLGRVEPGTPIATVRGRENALVAALDSANALQTSVAFTAEPIPHGFGLRATVEGDPVALRVVFAPDASITTTPGQHGIEIQELAEGVVFDATSAIPTLMIGDAPLVTFDLRGTPTLGEGVGLVVGTSDEPGAFLPITLVVTKDAAARATLLLRPAGPIAAEETGEGVVLTSGGKLVQTIDATAMTALRRGDRIALAARDARGKISRDLATFTIGADDLRSGRVPVVGVSSSGTRMLVPLTGAEGETLEANSELPTIFGVATPGASVQVTARSEVQEYVVTADARGTWKLTPAKPLPEGAHHVDVVIDGVKTTIPLRIDVTPPQPPTITGVAGVTVTGSAEPRSTVALLDPYRGTRLAVEADADGRFRATLPDTVRTLYLKSVDRAGNVSDTTTFDFPSLAASAAAAMTWRERAGFLFAIIGFIGLIALLRTGRRRPLPPPR